ncbi:MAG: hypothetical protein ABJA67_05660 [Chthonomonadales bacterium]
MKRVLPTILVLLVLFGLVRLFRVVQRYDPSVNPTNATDPMADVGIEMDGAEILSRKSGVLDWQVKADKIILKRSAYGGMDTYSRAEFTRVSNGKLYRDGKAEAAFTAHDAVYDPQMQQFQINGGIKLKSVANDVLMADQAIWSEREDSVQLERGMTGKIAGQTISAPYVLFSPKRRIVQCPQGAEAKFNGFPVQANNMTWDVNAGLVRCFGRVSGKRRGLEFHSESAEIQLDKGGLASEQRSKQPAAGLAHLRTGSGLALISIDPSNPDSVGGGNF